MFFPKRNWLIFLGMACGYACSILDTTITQIALPSMSEQLHAPLSTTSWVIHAYNIVFVVCLILAGRLADQFGRKRVFLVGFSLFGLSSLACALAPSLTWLIGFRVVQAVGGSCLGSVGFAIVSSIFVEVQQRTTALSIWSAIAAFSAIMGPILGGFVVSISWSWIFLLNLPFCLIGILLTNVFLPNQFGKKQVPPLDLLGILFLTSSLLCLTLVFVQGSAWGTLVVLLLLLLFVLSLGSFLLVERKSLAPLLTFSLFRIRSFTASCVGMFLFWTAFQGATLILSLYFLNAQARTPEITAFLLMPVPLANLLTSLLFKMACPAWIRAFVGISCGSLGLVLLASMNPFPLWYATLFPSILIGVGAAFCFTSFHVLVVSEVPEPVLGQASGIFNTFRQLATTLGAVVLLAGLTTHLQTGLSLISHRAGVLLQGEEELPFALRQRTATYLLQLVHQVITTGGIGQQPPRLDATMPFHVWMNQQVHLTIVDSFSYSWLIADAFALATFLMIPFLRQNRSLSTELVKKKEEVAAHAV